MEEVTKCCYIDCTDPQEKDHTLHELPVCNTALCIKWLVNTGHVDLISRDFETLRSMKFFICNNHFSEECYLSKGTLRDSAVPFPHWHNSSRRTPGQNQMGLKKNQEEMNTESSWNTHEGSPPTIDKKVQNESLDAQFTEGKDNPDLWCRTCAMRKQTDNLISMTTKMKDTDMSLLSKLKLLIEIDEEDALPTKMCDQCVFKLEQSFKFFQQIYVADNTLRRLLSRATPGTPPSLSELKSKDFAEPFLGKDNQYESQIPQGCDFSGFEVVESVRQTRQSRTIVPRTRRLVGRPRGSGSRLSRGSRNARASRTGRFSRGSRGWRSRGAAKINGLRPEAESADQTAGQESIQELGGRQQEFAGGSTVFSILTDTCHSDEELDWVDVLNLMSRRCEAEADGKTGSQWRCEFCRASFPFGRQLRAHLITNHIKHSEHTCADCAIVFNSETELTEHRASCHRETNYHCDHCQQGFSEKSKLSEHIVVCRPNDESLPTAKKRCFDSKDCIIPTSSTHYSIQQNSDREIEVTLKSASTVSDFETSTERLSRKTSASPTTDRTKTL